LRELSELLEARTFVRPEKLAPRLEPLPCLRSSAAIFDRNW
jgi:hypothetical protein